MRGDRVLLSLGKGLKNSPHFPLFSSLLKLSGIILLLMLEETRSSYKLALFGWKFLHWIKASRLNSLSLRVPL